MAEPAEILDISKDISDEPQLSAEEGRELLLSMLGMWTGKFAEYGGATAFYEKLYQEDDAQDAAS